ncbi:MAG: hypothetical protein J7L54_07190 [Elusimicrobia bacterium]|nr:hypothetical protein [Elusimicrobiota bacterium]
MKNIPIVVLAFIAVGPVFSGSFQRGWKLDPYYTYASFSYNFAKEELISVKTGEINLYKNLFKKSLKPTTALLEIFVSPLPYAAAWTKEKHRMTYDRFDLSENSNFLSILSAGEEDPTGVSLFLGKIVPFKPAGGKGGLLGVAYSGYLLTAGKKHFKNNLIYGDTWWQGEWKIKGIRVKRFSKQVWSFRLGAKFHDNPLISDIYYFSLYRDRIDFLPKKFSVWENSNFNIYAGFKKKDFSPVKLLFLLGKNFPKIIKHKKIIYSLSLGVLWEGTNRYSGEMKDTNKNPTLQFILRPNVKF